MNNQKPIMPDCLLEIYSLFCNRYINLKPSIILNILLVKTAQMLTSKRILIDEVGRDIIPNWFTMTHTLKNLFYLELSGLNTDPKI